MQKVTLSSKHQVVIPASVRKKMHLMSGDQLKVDKITNDSVVLKKVPGYHDLLGTLKPSKEDAVKRVRTLRDTWQ